MSNTHRYLPAFGRLLTAVLFVLSALGKIAVPAATIGYIGAAHLPFPEAAYGVSLIVELAGGLLLLIGYRAVCGGRAGIIHVRRSPWPQ